MIGDKIKWIFAFGFIILLLMEWSQPSNVTTGIIPYRATPEAPIVNIPEN